MSYTAALLLWLAAISRLRSARVTPDFTNLAFAASATAVATGFTIRVGEHPLDTATGLDLSQPLQHGTIVVGGVAANLFLLALRTGTPPRRQVLRRLATAAVVLLAMVGCFIAATHGGRQFGDLDDADLHPALVVYRAVFHVYLGVVLADLVRLCLRNITAVSQRAVRVNLLLVGLGSAGALLYSVSRLAYVLLDAAGTEVAHLRSLGTSAVVIGLLLLASGMLANHVVHLGERWVAARRGTGRLQPLWQDLVTVFPLVALPTRAPITVRRAELRYDRHLVEVADALSQARVSRPPGRRAPTVTDVALALHRSRPAWDTAGGPTAAELLPESSNLADDRALLLSLAGAYAALSAQAGFATQEVPA